MSNYHDFIRDTRVNVNDWLGKNLPKFGMAAGIGVTTYCIGGMLGQLAAQAQIAGWETAIAILTAELGKEFVVGIIESIHEKNLSDQDIARIIQEELDKGNNYKDLGKLIDEIKILPLMLEQILITNNKQLLDSFEKGLSAYPEIISEQTAFKIQEILSPQFGYISHNISHLDSELYTIQNILNTIIGMLHNAPQLNTEEQYFESLYSGYRLEVINSYKMHWEQIVIGSDKAIQHGQIPAPVGQVFTINYPLNQNKPYSRAKEPRIQSPDDLYTLFSTEYFQQLVFLIGEPGAGKTLAFRYLTAKLADKVESTRDVLPIFLPLNQYRPGEDLIEFITRILQGYGENSFHYQLSNNLKSLIEKKNYPICLIFDGINEIAPISGEDQNIKLLCLIQELTQIYPLIRCLISTRGKVDQPSNYPSIFIHPLDPSRTREFIRQFAPPNIDEIITRIQGNPNLQKMASNPFYLRTICQIFQSLNFQQNIPKTPGSLLRTYISALEEKVLGSESNRGLWNQTKINSWQCTISEIAKKQLESNTRSMTDEEVKQGELFNDHLRFAESLGIIYILEGNVNFLHDQFLEYFGALWLFDKIISDGNDAQDIDKAIQLSTWDESFYLLIGLISTFPKMDVSDLISKIAVVDPFLAARCAAVIPEKISSDFRQWFSEYLETCLREAIIASNPDLVKQVLSAVKNVHWSECIQFLIDPFFYKALRHIFPAVNKNFTVNTDFLIYYLKAIAATNTPEAAKFLLQEIDGNDTNIEYYINALSLMTVPEAASFFSKHFFDKRYYKAIVKAIAVNRIAGFDKVLQKMLLGTSCMVDRREKFDMVAEAIGKAGITSLIPTLLLFRDQPAIFKSLLFLDAGQAILDDFIDQWKITMGIMDNGYDPFTNIPDDTIIRKQRKGLFLFSNRYNGLAYTWTSILRNLGQEAIEEYYDLLIHCVKESQDLRAAVNAADALLFFRVYRALPIIEERYKEEYPQPDTKSGDTKDSYARSFKNIIWKFKTPLLNSTKNIPLENFVEKTLRWGLKEFNNVELPLDLLERIRLGYEKPELIRNIAIDIVFYQDFSDPVSIFGGPTILLAAAKYLMKADPDLGLRVLISLLSQYRKYDILQGTNHAWEINQLFIEFGKKGDEQRNEIIKQVSPLALGNDQVLQRIAIDILAELNASEACRDLLFYLNDNTWMVAYAIVGAIQRLNPDNKTYQLILNRLNSPNDSERYFAALAIGELRRNGYWRELIKLKDDPSIFVRRAMLTALAKAEIENNLSEPVEEIIKVISQSLSFVTEKSGWVRLEAARTIGCLKINQLASQLVDTLNDPDLRVVEQAVIALGKLRYEQSIPKLLNILTLEFG